MRRWIKKKFSRRKVEEHTINLGMFPKRTQKLVTGALVWGLLSEMFRSVKTKETIREKVEPYLCAYCGETTVQRPCSFCDQGTAKKKEITLADKFNKMIRFKLF